MAPPAPAQKVSELGEAETIKINGPSFELVLPLVEHARRMYPKSMTVFKLPTDASDVKERIVVGLKAALERAVQRVPWLACELKVNPASSGLVKGLASGMISKSSWIPSALKASPEQALKAKLHYNIAPGPALLFVRRDNPKIKYSEMGSDDFLEDLFPALPVKDVKSGTETEPSMGVQAIFTADNYLFLSFAIHHALADGRTHMDAVRLVSEEFSAVTSGKDLEAPVMIAGVCDRSRVNTLSPTGTVSRAAEDAHLAMKIWGATEVMGLVVKMQRSKQVNLDRRFVFDRRTLEALVPEPNPLGISVHDLACALVWRGAMAARLAQGKLTPRSQVGFGMTVCIRRHLPRNTEEPYWGNAISAIQVHLPIGDLLAGDEGLVAGARVIRQAITKCNLDDARAATALYVAASDLRLVQSREMANIGTSFVFLTTWNSFRAWDMSWGPLMGDYMGVQMPSGANRPDGLMVMLSPFKSGDFNVALALEEKSMAELQRDQVFTRHARPLELER